MNAIALTLSLLIASPICYHPGIFYPGGSDAVCMDEVTMRGGRAVVLSVGLTGLAGGMAYQMPKIEARPVEARLTGGAVHMPCQIKEDASDLIPDVECGKRSRPDRKGQSNPAKRRPTRGSTGSTVDEEVRAIRLGDVLAGGEIGELNRAVLLYERKTSGDPRDAQGWSNLAAIYLTRAQKTDDPRDLLRAYGAASRAVEEDERLLEARFNQAVALERLFLPNAARTAWGDYGTRDTAYGWAQEAGQRLKALDPSGAIGVWSEQEVLLWEAALRGDTGQVKAIVDLYRQAAREYAEQKLFGAWGDAVLADQKQTAADSLTVLRAVGDALAQTSGERLVQDSVAAIDDASNTSDFQRLNELARGARYFRDGYKAYKDRREEPARSNLTAAYEALRLADCALAWRAAFFLVSTHYIFNEYAEAVAGAAPLAEKIETEKLPYGALLAHVYWIKGMAEATLGKTREAVDDLNKSFDGFKHLGESENAANIDCRLGEVLMSRGRRSEAWRFIYRALRSTPRLRDPDQVAAVYMIAGNAALQDGLYDAALAFQEERVRQSRLNKGNFLAQVEALTGLAHFQHHRGDNAGAQASLEEAERLVEKVEEKQRPRRRVDLAMIKGMMIEERDPDQAVNLLSSALPTYEKENNAVFSLWTHLARGRAYRKAGKDDQAESDFEAALELYGRMGEKLGAEDLRLALLQEADSVFDEIVDLHAGQDRDRAFAYGDRARTRVLPGSASKLWTGLRDETNRLLASEPESLALDEIRRRLPQGVTLVQYSVLRESVLIRTLRRSGKGEVFSRQPISRSDLEDKVARLWAFDTPDGDEAARELFDRLIQPWLPSVPADERIVLIPDKVLHRVPFNVLKKGDKRLIETHTLAFTPSATLYVNTLERQGSKPLDLSRGLVVGEPEIDRRVPDNKTLSSLPAAKDEALRLAERTRAKLLVGPAATKAAFLAEAPRAEWIQFSGHAVIDPINTLLSKLVLAPGKNGDNDNGALTAREIYSQKLSGTRLVVLAACDTGNEYVPGGEGVTSLARAFLAAGVPTVVASLWSVDDEATAHLFEYFHDNYQKNGDPVIALREAQLKMLRSSEGKEKSPWAWAAFEVIGASAGDQP